MIVGLFWLFYYYISLLYPCNPQVMVEAGEGGTHVGSVMNQLEDTSREIKECYER